MSPTVFKQSKYHFFFNSREEARIHVHIKTKNGEAKFWLEPVVSYAVSYNLSKKEIKEIQSIIEERQDEIKKSWKKHFKNHFGS